MDNKIKKLLFDIHTAINNIEDYIGSEKEFEKYENNPMLQDAVERNIEIMGEAMNRLLNSGVELNISNARRIVDARNKIIHGYDEIENVQVWGIVINSLPILKVEIQAYLD